MSEPPLAIGRGLTVATGTIGCMLAMAVLWTMLPTRAGRDAQATVRSTVANRTDGITDRTDSTSTTTPPAARTTHEAVPISSVPSSFAGVTSTPEQPRDTNGPTTVPTRAAPPTYQVQQGSEITETAIAVAVQDGNLVITTSEAVSADRTVTLMMPGGELATAQVLFVDDRSGLAVLAPDALSGTMAFTVATEVVAGDELTFYGEVPTTFTVTDALTISSAWADDTSIAEGSPVLNQRGELVALCSRAADGGPRLVQLGNLDQLQQAIDTPAGSTTVWLGVVLNDDPADSLTIGAVDPAGPAAAAGLAPSDVGRSRSAGEAARAHPTTADPVSRASGMVAAGRSLLVPRVGEPRCVWTLRPTGPRPR